MRHVGGKLKKLLTRVMSKRFASFALGALVFALGSIVEAQQAKRIARIGYLGGATANAAFNLKPFRERLRELGYIEGQNIVIEIRHHEGKVEHLPGLAAELVGLNCHVVVTNGTEAAVTAKSVIKTIPVVMGFGADAVRRGIVADLARPGGNITGLTDVGAEINGKRLELLNEVVPKLSRVGFLWHSSYPDADILLKETETVAQALKIEIQSLQVKAPTDFEATFKAAGINRVGALLVAAGGLFGSHRNRIAELAVKHRLPTTYDNTVYVQAGGLMSYTANRPEQFRRAAEYVDRILKGAKPADLPVERPKKFELVINLKTAKQIGLTIPPNVLARADRVIK
jgi:putative tryptophan/tyrosine transport system substrate-binding protein